MSDEVFLRRVELPADAAEVFRWHARPGALERMIPPWEDVRLRSRTGGLEPGSRVELETRLGPLSTRWIAEHVAVEEGRSFRDVQVRGPFRRWDHVHSIEPAAEPTSGNDSRSVLEDRVEYALPLGTLGAFLGGRLVRRKLDRMFAWRHETLAQDIQRHTRTGLRSMRILVTGSTGLVGSSLVPFLTTGGHEVVRLVRHQAPGRDEIGWDPERGSLETDALEGADAVVHLAGENVAAKRWTPAQKMRIASSRVTGTKTLCEALASLESKPSVLVCASAVGYYGDRGDEEVDESSLPGSGFLAEVCRDWEAATKPAADAGIRVVNVRFGVILSSAGGALAKMLTPFKLGLGGPIGDGEQYMSWIDLGDVVGAVHHAVATDELSGPVNVVAPHPVTNREFTKTLGKVLGRPTVLPMPGFAARVAFGEMADEMLLAGQRVRPTALQRSGFEFGHPELEGALRHVLGK